MAIALFLWTLTGREVITADTQHLIIEKRLFSFGRKRVYRVSDSANIRVLANASTGSFFGTPGFSWGVAGGSVAFDYGMKTIKFGIFLEEAEAKHIIDELRKHNFLRE